MQENDAGDGCDEKKVGEGGESRWQQKRRLLCLQQSPLSTVPSAPSQRISSRHRPPARALFASESWTWVALSIFCFSESLSCFENNITARIWYMIYLLYDFVWVFFLENKVSHILTLGREPKFQVHRTILRYTLHILLTTGRKAAFITRPPMKYFNESNSWMYSSSRRFDVSQPMIFLLLLTG